MAKNVRIKWRIAGFEEIRRLPRLKAELFRHAQSMAEEAGPGFEAFQSEGKTRSRASVVAVSARAQRSNAKYNTLNRILARRRVGL